jgi:uncharacterized protein with NRDE domain
MTMKPEDIQNKGPLDPDAVEHCDGRRHRGFLKDQITAVVNGWIDPSHPAWAKVMRNADQLQDSEDPRVAHNASLLAIKMIEVAQKHAEFQDKTDRLDSGEATENMGIRIIYEQDNGD